MKIVIATAVYYPQINGVAVFSHNLAVGLMRRGHEVMVICPSQTGRRHVEMVDGVKTVFLKSIDAKVYPDQIHAVPAKKKVMGKEWPRLWYKHGLRVSVFPGREVRQVLDEFQPDVVHVQVSDPIGLAVVKYARRHRIPVVTTEHNQPDVITEQIGVPRVLKKPVNGMLSAYFVNRQSKSDFVTMPTELAIEKLIWSRGKEFKVPVAAVSNGVDLTHFKPGKAPKEIYEKYGVPEGVPVMLYVGRIDPEKNVATVVRAFAEVKRRVPNAALVMVGDGTDKPRLEKLAKKLGIAEAVKFLGRVLPPDLYELYKVGWVFVTASEVETQGIVLIEAAASGLPLVAVKGGAVEDICRDGEDGFLCESGNITEMAEVTAKILSDDKLRRKLAGAAVRIAGEHDFERTLTKFENIYRRVVGKGKVRYCKF
ncbi:glycosyltransferase [Candidatus Saccharibacteria bacterium]|nr:glycosyltransferase [Candidatus Saccharibacteria bacterium]